MSTRSPSTTHSLLLIALGSLFLGPAACHEFDIPLPDCSLADLDDDGYFRAYDHESLFLYEVGEYVDGERPPLCDAEGETELLRDTLVDCDDADPEINPGADELCDGIDNNCDGLIEQDVDGDGYMGTGTCADDCDDTNPEIHPGADESCNWIDDDCDGLIDNGFDGDGDGWTSCDGDCDDTATTVHPGADEGCDGLDTDCDGFLSAGEIDGDGDGFTSCGLGNGEQDCDDTRAEVHPGAEELCDGLDTDCSGSLDLNEVDSDGDSVFACEDCDDTDPDRAPRIPEWCDGKDNDCDGVVDQGYDLDGDGWTSCSGDCDDSDDSIYPGAEERCNGVDDSCDDHPASDEADLDADGWYVCDGDCDDSDATIYPGAAESCNGLDDDCDGSVPSDEMDADADGASSCAGDCDDGDPVANQHDLDADGWTPCDGDCDDLDASLNLLDADGDGVTTCGGDCDDLDAAFSPLVGESCNEIDDDCDGLVDEDFADENGDGIADCIEICDGIDNDGDGGVDEGFTSGGLTGTWVSASAGSTDGVGTYLDPALTVQQAIARSLTDGACSILVEPGTYPDPIVLPATPVVIESTDGPELTILEGSTAGPILLADNGVGSDTVVDGFTFRDGALLDSAGTGEPTLRQGAAVQIYDASPTLSCNRFEDNQVADRGAAIYIEGGSPLIYDSLFMDNEALGAGGEDGGGAIYIAPSSTGGDVDPVIHGCTFLSNVSASHGGGVHAFEDTSLTVTASRFAGNVSDGMGGGLALSEADALVDGALFQGNLATSGGALISGTDFVTVTLAHLTVLENDAVSGYGGGVAFEADNTILSSSILGWPTGGGVIGWVTDDYAVEPVPTIEYSLFYDPTGASLYSNFGALSPPGSDGNISSDPHFAAYDADGDLLDDSLVLDTISPAIDAGDPADDLIDTDGSSSDMGGLGGLTPYEPVPTCFGSMP